MLKRFINDVKKYFMYSIYSARSQLRAEVANSYLNRIWWVLDPFCFMLIYTFIFGYVFNSKEQYFPIFIFIGITMWDFFQKTTTQSIRLVKNNKQIVSKVYLPKFILILTKIWVNGFKALVSFGIVLIMMVLFRVPVTWNVLYIIPTLVTLVLFTFGVSTFLLHYGVYVEDLGNVVKIVLRFMFYLTGIFYNVERKIPVYGKVLNHYNPMGFLITSARNCLLYSAHPHRRLLLMWFAVSFVLSVFGIIKIYKEENSYVKVI